MKMYRLAYENLFLTSDVDHGVPYKGENISDVSIYMVYKITDKKTGEEVLFREEELDDQQFEYAEGEFCYVNHFYKCVIDEKDAYKMIPNEKFHEKSNYTVSYEVGDCMKWVERGKPVIIEHDEFVDILKNNFTKFDLTVNKPTQSTSYYAVEVSPIIPTH